MNKREKVLALIRTAAYHDDQTAALRLYVENRISFDAYSQAWIQGKQARAARVKCGCYECNKGSE